MPEFGKEERFEDIRVLILEDNPADAELIEYELKGNGIIYTSKLVAARNDYTKALREYRPDIILSDYDLPGFSGQEALRIKKEQSPETPFILISGVVTEERAIEILTGGATDYVLKKNLSRLLPAVRRALHEAYEHRKRREAEVERDHLLNDLEKMVRERTSALQTEIEERRGIEEELRNSMLREQNRVVELNAVLEGMSEGLIMADVLGKVLLINQSGAVLLGFSSPAEYLKRLEKSGSEPEFLYPDGTPLPSKDQPLPRVLRGETLRDFLVHVRRPDTGREIVLSYNGSLVYRYGYKKPFFALLTFRDVTERQHQEELLREGREQYRDLVETADSIIMKVDRSGKVTFSNRYAQDFFGYSPEEMLGADIRKFVPAAESTSGRRLKKLLRGLLQNPDQYSESVNENVKKSGERVWISWRNRGVRDSRGSMNGFLAVGQDITGRMRAEEKLRIALSAGRMGIWVADAGSGIVQTDDLYRRLWDLDPDQEFASYEVIWDRIYPDDRERVTRFANRLRKRGPLDEEFRVIHRNGEVRWLGAFAVPYHASDGKLQSIVGVNFDITERKRIEESLRESEERYRLIFENSLSGILITDNKGTILNANPAAEKIFGAPLEEIRKFGRYGLVDRSDPRFKKARRERARTGAYFGEMIWKRADGTPLTVEISSSQFRNRRGEEFLSVIFRDISWRKQAEKVLKESAQQFREMAEAMPQLVWTGTPEGRIDYFNSRYSEFSGIKRDPAGYWKWLPAIHPEDVPATREAWKRGVETQMDSQVEHRLKGRDGGYRWYLSRGVIVRDKAGKAIRWIGTTTDIHELKLAEQELKERTRELEEANRELESFSYSVSHDLRAPLRAIDGFSRMLLDKEESLDEETIRRIHTIRHNAVKMDRLINDLLSFSRSGRVPLSLGKIAMDRLVKEIWQEQISTNPERKMELKEGKLPGALGDEMLLRQVLSNIMGNAVKFTGKRKTAVIEIGGKSEGRENIYWVKDNGSGFDMKYCDKLFGVFQRLHPAAEFEGTGVGLAIVQRIIHRHGGRVWAEGKEGKGATFYFSLPKT